MADNNQGNTSGSKRWLGGVALFLAVICLAHASLLIGQGVGVFAAPEWLHPALLLDHPLPALGMAAWFGLAFWQGRQGSYQRCFSLLAWAFIVLSVVFLIPQGVHSPGWYLQPLVALLVTCLFGWRQGVLQASLVVLALAVSAWAGSTGSLAPMVLPGYWLQALIAGAIVVAMVLFGMLLQKTLNQAISAEVEQDQKFGEVVQALRNREKLLRHAMRVDTVGEVSGMIVHHLRNQFQVILGHSALGLSVGEKETQEQFEAVMAAVDRCNGLLESLLGMVRSKDEDLEAVNLVQQCQLFCQRYAGILPANVELRQNLPDQPLMVSLDPQGLEHALLNLVINAHQAIVGEGMVEVGVSAEDGDQVVLRVRDTGAGIPKEIQDQVFKPFFTTKAKGKGTGLGLAAVHQFMQACQGKVRVESEPGQGTCFSLYFPLLEGQGGDRGKGHLASQVTDKLSTGKRRADGRLATG